MYTEEMEWMNDNPESINKKNVIEKSIWRKQKQVIHINEWYNFNSILILKRMNYDCYVYSEVDEMNNP